MASDALFRGGLKAGFHEEMIVSPEAPPVPVAWYQRLKRVLEEKGQQEGRGGHRPEEDTTLLFEERRRCVSSIRRVV